MKIGVFGDSYADRRIIDLDRSDESWMKHIEQQGYDITTHGIAGTSCWYSYKKFIEHHMNYDHIVFCYSSPYRVHNLPKHYDQFASFIGQTNHLHLSANYNKLPEDQKNEVKTILNSLILTQEDMLDEFICQNIFNHVNEICKIKNINLVNVLPFENDTVSNIKFTNRRGDCLTNLLRVSLTELPDFGKGLYSDPRYCHLSLENNKVFANIVLKSLQKPLKQIIDVSENPDFVYEKKITNRYMALVRQLRKKYLGA